MRIQKNFYSVMLAFCLVLKMITISVCAEDVAMCMESRWNNIAVANLSIGFDSNNMGYFSISLDYYPSCTGLSGQMRLYDENGTLLAGWAIYDDVSPYGVEKTYQCQSGKTYTVTFQGYAYGNGSTMYDDINLSGTDTCD